MNTPSPFPAVPAVPAATDTADTTTPALIDWSGNGIPGLSDDAKARGYELNGSPFVLDLTCTAVLEPAGEYARWTCGGRLWSVGVWDGEHYNDYRVCSVCGGARAQR